MDNNLEEILPMFSIEHVKLQFEVNDIVQLEVENSIFFIAMPDHVLRIDLNFPQDVQNISIPLNSMTNSAVSQNNLSNFKNTKDGQFNNSESIERIFLDPTGSHLLVCTNLNEVFYLAPGGKNFKNIPKLRGLHISAVNWNPNRPTSSTTDILIGTFDGKVIETYIEFNDSNKNSELVSSSRFSRYTNPLNNSSIQSVKFTKIVWESPKIQPSQYNSSNLKGKSNSSENSILRSPIVGIHTDILDTYRRRVMIVTPGAVFHWINKVKVTSGQSVYSNFFTHGHSPTIQEFLPTNDNRNAFAVSYPIPLLNIQDDNNNNNKINPSLKSSTSSTSSNSSKSIYNDIPIYAYLTELGVSYGYLFYKTTSRKNLGYRVFESEDIISNDLLDNKKLSSKSSNEEIRNVILSKYHIIILSGNTIYAFNRLNKKCVYKKNFNKEEIINICADQTAYFYWVYTIDNIYEIVITDEDRDIWRILLDKGQYDEALSLVKTPQDKNEAINLISNHYMKTKEYMKAAELYASSSQSFESVAISFMEIGQYDALAKYLQSRLDLLHKKQFTQRIMLSTWILQLYLQRINKLDNELQAINPFKIITHHNIELSGSNESKMKSNDNNFKNENENENDNENENEIKKNEIYAKEVENNRLSIKKEIDRVKKAYVEFINSHRNDLDHDAAYEILCSHDREEELLIYLRAAKDDSAELKYWVLQENWNEALRILSSQTTSKKEGSDPVDLSLFYKYATVLLSNAPEKTVNLWNRIPELDPSKLVYTLTSFVKSSSLTPNLRWTIENNPAVKYLVHTISVLHSTNPVVHNTLVSLYAAYCSNEKEDNDGENEKPLLIYLESQGSNPCYDIHYALRLCIRFNRTRSSAYIYSVMGLHREAVNLALEHDDISLAVSIVDQAGGKNVDGYEISFKSNLDENTLKELWLKIIKRILQYGATQTNGNEDNNEKILLKENVSNSSVFSMEDGIKEAVKLLHQSEILQIEDILPYFPDTVMIDSFRDEVCDALENYSKAVEELKNDMDSCTITEIEVKKDIEELSKRFALVEPGESCMICSYPLLTQQFYVFPCQHAFHGSCLIEKVLFRSSKLLRKRIMKLQAEVQQGKDPEALDSIVASECPLCGDAMIQTIDEPFIYPSDAEDMRQWQI